MFELHPSNFVWFRVNGIIVGPAAGREEPGPFTVNEV